MEIGTVISNENGLYVITEIVNGQIEKLEKLEDYITKNVFINYNGSPKTIREIIELHCDKYLMGNKVIDQREKSTWKAEEVNFILPSEDNK